MRDRVHLVKEGSLAGIGEAEDENVVVAVGLEDLAPHRRKEPSHAFDY